MNDPAILHMIEAAALPSESPSDRFAALLRLAEANGDDLESVNHFIRNFPQPKATRYVQWYRADELLSHYRTWKDKSADREKFWIRVMESRANKDELKIWLLGEDQIGLTACFTSLLGVQNVNIEEEYGTVSPVDKFSILSIHVEKRVILERFNGRQKDLKATMEGLSSYLKKGLTRFFSSSGCIGPDCITALDAKDIEMKRWLNPRYFARLRAGNGRLAGEPWWHVFDIQDVDIPRGHRLRETWLLCLLFSHPRVVSPQGNSPHGQGGAIGTLHNAETGRMPNIPPSPGSPHHARPAGSKRSGEQASPPDPDSIFDPDFFNALGDPTRLKLFRMLLESNEPLAVSELYERSGYKKTTVSACLQELKAVKLVDFQPSGKYRLYFACVDRFRERLESVLAYTPPRNPSRATGKIKTAR
jgi:DNA-binding transcriptional ArsR family regulator